MRAHPPGRTSELLDASFIPPSRRLDPPIVAWSMNRSPIDLRRRALALLLAAWLGAAVAQVAAPSPAALEGADAATAVELANAWKGADVLSFVTPQAVHFVFPGGQEVAIPLPDEVMLVSVAPYLVHTHPCATHYMSGCQGELAGATFHVRAVSEDGSVLIDGVRTAGANGFLDLWLPRGQRFELTFDVDGYRAVGVVGTHVDSPTCITTLQLARQ
jgi:hypothetical protein